MYGGATAEAVPDGLRYRLASAAAIGLFALSVFVPPASMRWVFAIAVWATVVGYAHYRLDQNHVTDTDTARRQIGLANDVTLFRGWLLAIFAGVVFAPPSPLVPVFLFTLVVLLDAADGAIARRTAETLLGARLDAATDALTVLVGAAAVVAVGALPAWYLLAGISWYVYTAAVAIRRRSGAPVYPLPESYLRPIVGIAQFIVIVLALLVGSAVWLRGFAALALAVLLVAFVRDWAAVSGWIGNSNRSALSSPD